LAYKDSLYIPHGSDESEEAVLKKAQKKYFISHMVQMKEAVLVRIVAIM